MSAITQQWCAECGVWKEHGTWQHKEDPSELPSSTGSASDLPTLSQAERLCRIYFEIAAEAIGEDAVREKRDQRIKAMTVERPSSGAAGN